MVPLITNARPATLMEAGYSKSAKERRDWFLVYRPSTDEIGITPTPGKRDEVISTYEPEEV